MDHGRDVQDSTCTRRSILVRAASSLAAAGLPIAANANANASPGDILGILSRDPTSEKVKQRAIADYRRSHCGFGGQLASPISELLKPSNACSKGQMDPWHFDVAVIGSGYGGSICAARLAQRMRPGAKLAIIERGKEWVPGTFPDRFPGVAKECRHPLFGLDKRTIRNPTGLINLMQGKDISVMTSCGLGGGSLINANVAIRPDWELFEQPIWPTELSSMTYLEPYFDLVEQELGCAHEPIDQSWKMRAQRLAAESLRDCGAHFEAANLAITRDSNLGLPIVNRHGVIQRPCVSCGDCMTGCNVGAKNTLAMNYLPLARQSGAQIFCESEIERIAKHDGYYSIHYVHYQRRLDTIFQFEGALELASLCWQREASVAQNCCYGLKQMGFDFRISSDVIGAATETLSVSYATSMSVRKSLELGPIAHSNVHQDQPFNRPFDSQTNLIFIVASLFKMESHRLHTTFSSRCLVATTTSITLKSF